MEKSRWKEIWNSRQIDTQKLRDMDEFNLYKELKRLDGFDVQVDNVEGYYKGFYNGICELLGSKIKDAKSVFEVGCGSGANLLIFKNREIAVGGIDYSEQLIDIAKNVIQADDIGVNEAIDLDTSLKYDVVISDSVFAYFDSISYGEQVLEKMYQKAISRIVLLEIFDKEMEVECNSYRRSLVDNYDEKYKGLQKTFYPKQMFIDFAKKYNCSYEFSEVKNDFYWNSKYMFNCILTKN